MGVLEALKSSAEVGQLVKAVSVRREVEGDPGFTLHGRLQIFVHIVPILVVVFQKALEILLVVNDHAVHPIGGEEDLQRLQPGVIRVNVYFQPFHI